MGSLKKIQPINTGLHGEILIPGDKSVSHRSVMFAGLCDSKIKITNFLHDGLHINDKLYASFRGKRY